MRILLLNTYPQWGGDERWTINLGYGLKLRGHHVVIASLPNSTTEKYALEKGLSVFPFAIKADIALWKVIPF